MQGLPGQELVVLAKLQEVPAGTVEGVQFQEHPRVQTEEQRMIHDIKQHIEAESTNKEGAADLEGLDGQELLGLEELEEEPVGIAPKFRVKNK